MQEEASNILIGYEIFHQASWECGGIPNIQFCLLVGFLHVLWHDGHQKSRDLSEYPSYPTVIFKSFVWAFHRLYTHFGRPDTFLLVARYASLVYTAHNLGHA